MPHTRTQPDRIRMNFTQARFALLLFGCWHAGWAASAFMGNMAGRAYTSMEAMGGVDLWASARAVVGVALILTAIWGKRRPLFVTSCLDASLMVALWVLYGSSDSGWWSAVAWTYFMGIIAALWAHGGTHKGVR